MGGYYSYYSWRRRRSRNVCCPKYTCVKKTCYDEVPCYWKYWDAYIAGELYPYCQNGYKQQVKEVLDDCCVSYECVCDECPDHTEYELQEAQKCQGLQDYYDYWYYWLYGEKKLECGLKRWTDTVDSCGCKQPKECACCTREDPDPVCEIKAYGQTYTFSSNNGFRDGYDYGKTCYCNEWDYSQADVDSSNALYKQWYGITNDYFYMNYNEQAICFNDRAFCPQGPVCNGNQYYHIDYWTDCCIAWSCKDIGKCTDKQNPDECAAMFPDKYVPVPICTEEEELDDGEYIDSEECCKVYTCKCKEHCPIIIPDPVCMNGGTIETI